MNDSLVQLKYGEGLKASETKVERATLEPESKLFLELESDIANNYW